VLGAVVSIHMLNVNPFMDYGYGSSYTVSYFRKGSVPGTFT
jgi:hypothetical protein